MGVDRPIDITAGQRKTILALLQRHLPGTAAWVYGSRATWTSRPQSDLDLVVFATPEHRRGVGNLREAFEESDLPFRVDLFVWDEVPETFRKEIETEHVVLVEGRDQDAASQQLFDALPEGWKYTTLGIACATAGGDIQTGPFGSQLHASDYVPSGIPSIMPQNIGDNRILENGISRITPDDASRLSRYLVRKGDIVYSRRGDVKRRALVRSAEDGWLCGTGCLRIRLGKTGVDSRYASYYLGHPDVQEWIARHAHGATMPNLNNSILSECPFVIPPKSEQRAIAQILGTLDDKIELNRRMNETLETMARALFKDWFVDFGPVRAKVEGRAPYLAPEIWSLFPDSLDSEDQPAGWEPSELGDRAEVLDSKRIPLSSRERQKRQGPHPYHGAAGVVDYVDDYLFDGVHVLLGEDGSVVKPNGKPFTQYVWGKFWANNHAHVLQGKGISNEMLSCFLEQVDIAPYVTGAVQPKLNQKNLKSVPFPPGESTIVACFGAVIEPLFEQLRFYTEQSRTLRQTRELLLPKLMSGELRLPDAEKVVEAVACHVCL